MKVEIGPYTDGVEPRAVSVEVHPYDTWNMDVTLATIVHPMLVQLKETKHGSPCVEDEDVPEELRSTSAPPKENEWDTDDNHFKRWDWVLDRMIAAFADLKDGAWDDQYYSGNADIVWESVPDSDLVEMKRGPNDTFRVDAEGLKAHEARIDDGLRLFGKYFRALWD